MIAVAIVASGSGPGSAEAPKPSSPAKRAGPAKKGPAAPAKPPRFERADVMRMHMHENFDLLRAIERLLIFGKLDDAKRFAAAISEAPDSPAHGPWAAHVVEVRDKAAALARATSVEQALRREAELAGACAGCHVEAGVGPQLGEFPPPPDVPTVEGRMLRHRWAADRMWEGIVAGADEPWRAGLAVLRAKPLDWGPDRAEHARDLQRLAALASTQKGSAPDARVRAYGHMLVTCAACHTGKPAPVRKLP